MFIWVWQIEKIVKRYGNIERVIHKLKELGISNVCIKFHEGCSKVGGGVNFRNDFLKYAPIFKANGFKVGSWGYNYFNNLDIEASLIIEALNNSDYYIFDPESHVKGKFEQAEYICRKVRQAHPNAVIGYSSFPIVSYHRSVPYDVFNKYCDFASPQTYFEEMQWSVDKCMIKTLEDHKNYNLNKPIHPSIQGYRQEQDIYNQFKKYGYKNFGVWSLDHMDSEFEKWIKEINIHGENNIENTETENDKESNISYEKSASIKQLQQLFNLYGFTDENGYNLKEDGIVGNHTKAAVKKCVFKYGARNEIIRWIQNRLIDKGYILKKYGADGIFGNETLFAVTSFQKNNHLIADGIIGKNTWAKLL
jgi:hypothetical protein